MANRQHEMTELLRHTFFEDGPLSRVVYENYLEDEINHWHVGIQISEEQYLFAVAEQNGEVALVLIESPDRQLYINGAARDRLSQIWKTGYRRTLDNLIPMMAEDLVDSSLSVNGVRHVT